MPHPLETLGGQENNTQYLSPDISDIGSWDLEKLEDEFKKIESERIRLMKLGEREATPENPDGRDATITRKIRELAKIGMEIFAKLEEKRGGK